MARIGQGIRGALGRRGFLRGDPEGAPDPEGSGLLGGSPSGRSLIADNSPAVVAGFRYTTIDTQFGLASNAPVHQDVSDGGYW